MPTSRNKVRGGARQLGARAPGRQVVALDFETYYDAEYTLRKLSTSEYIRDERFEVISVAIKVGTGPTEVFFGKDVKVALGRVDWSQSTLLAHHAHFDGLILTHHFGHVPAFYYDTLSMGRALHPKAERNDLATVAVRYGAENKLEMPDFKGKRAKDLTDEERAAIAAYNARDVDSMVQVFEKMVANMPESELRLVDLTVRMFAEPVLELDVPLAKRELRREIKERKAFIAASNALAMARQHGIEVKPKKKGEKVDNERVLASNKIFAELLRKVGIEPPLKVSKYNGKPTYALSKADEEFTDLLAHPDQQVVALVRGRLAAKSTIGETRAARLLRSGTDGKKLPVYLNYCGAHTTRWSGGDKLNYQNLKKKGEIRKAIKAPKGQVLVVIDSSQIEARMVAWLAGEQWLMEAFREGKDPYLIFGSEVYGRPITKADKPERFVSKTCVLGLGFQMGGPKLQVSILTQSIIQLGYPMRLELPVCYGLVNKYRSKNSKIVDLWSFMHDTVIAEVAKGDGAVKTYKALEYGREFVGLKGGLRMHYPAAECVVTKKTPSAWSRNQQTVARVEHASYESINGRTKMYGGMMTENAVQFLARMVVAEQMLAIAERHRVVMMTHDEVVFLAPKAQAQQALDFGLKIMHTPPAWAPDLPVAAEGGFDTVYSK